jgi:hypothetical protein
MTVRILALAACLAALPVPIVAQPSPHAQAPRIGQPVTAPAPGPQSATPAPRREGQPATAPAPPGQPGPPMPRREGQPTNVKVEVTITDQRGGTQALRKTVTVVTGDSMSGFIRSSANYSGIGPVPLNLDTEPQILADGKIRLRVNLQYTLPAASSQGAEMPGAGSLRTTEIHENLAMILDSGKPLVVAQSADPVGDRQVTIEVRATVLR